MNSDRSDQLVMSAIQEKHGEDPIESKYPWTYPTLMARDSGVGLPDGLPARAGLPDLVDFLQLGNRMLD